MSLDWPQIALGSNEEGGQHWADLIAKAERLKADMTEALQIETDGPNFPRLYPALLYEYGQVMLQIAPAAPDYIKALAEKGRAECRQLEAILDVLLDSGPVGIFTQQLSRHVLLADQVELMEYALK